MWRPHVRNRDGETVDPVPALVVILTGFLVAYAWGPLYLLSLGFSLEQSLVVLTVVFAGIVAATVHQLIWHAHPEYRGEVPSAIRLERVREAVLIGIALLVLLAMPYVRYGG